MNNDMSWYGLIKKGYSIEIKMHDGTWMKFDTVTGLYIANQKGYKIRYKHSIQ